MSERDLARRGDVGLQERTRVERPRRYQVLLHNDDFTTMEFVVEILQRFFRKSQQEAFRIMLEIHQQGRGVAGVYPFSVAETKVAQVTETARRQSMPLKVTMSPE